MSNLPVSHISSISETAFQFMDAAKVNTLSLDQLKNGLTISQVVALKMNSEYSSFSTNTKKILTDLSVNDFTRLVTVTSSSLINSSSSIFFNLSHFFYVLFCYFQILAFNFS